MYRRGSTFHTRRRSYASHLIVFPAKVVNTSPCSLLQFAFEGDNRADAQILASVVSKLFGGPSGLTGVSKVEWKQPESWNGGLFGTPHDQTLYG
jgi:hypothetical protein